MKESHFVVTTLFICLFMIGIILYVESMMNKVNEQLKAYSLENKRLVQELRNQREINERILEQNINLITRVAVYEEN